MPRRPDTAFWTVLGVAGGLYVLLIVLMLSADVLYTTPGHLLEALRSREIRFAVWMSLFTSLGSAVLSILVAVPMLVCFKIVTERVEGLQGWAKVIE